MGSAATGGEHRDPRGRAALWLVAVALALCFAVPATAAAADPVIAAAGDIACDPASHKFQSGLGTSDACRQLYTSNLMLDGAGAPTVNAILPLGDNQYYCGGPGSWNLSYSLSWGRTALRMITYPVPGNHEYVTDGGSSPSEATGCNSGNTGGTGYFGYWGTSFGTSGNASKGYYSFDIGTWHIIALNSQCSAAGGCGSSSPQGSWLRSDLAAHQNMCTLAYWHVPLFSSGGRASSTYKTFWDALYQYEADVVLNGHDHTYERFAPQTPSGAVDNARGIREWVVGSGGANHTSWATTARNSEKRNNTVYGILKLTLHPAGYDWSFVPEARDVGKFSDSGTGSCHGPVPDTQKPTAPTGLTATAVGSNRIDLSWTASTDDRAVTRYDVYRDGSKTALASVTSGTTYSDTTLLPSSTHSYVVKAFDGAGNMSDPSNVATATTSAGNTVLQFTPAADAWIDQAVPGANYGSAVNLEVDGSPVRDTLLRFDVSGIGTKSVVDATLRLAITNGSSGNTTTQVYRAAPTSWTEAGVTWANAPAADLTRRFAALGPVSAGSTYTLDLGNAAVTGDGTVTFRLISGSTDGTQIASRETATKPLLTVTAG